MRQPLVLLPGMMCDADLFAPQIEALADEAEIVVGDITRHESVDRIAQAVLSEAPFERFALGGLSMGGIVALAMIEQAPQRVERLALLDTNHRSETPERQVLRGPQIAAVVAGDLREVLVEEMKPNYLGAAQATDQALLDRILAMGLRLGADVFARQSRALRDRPDRSQALRSYPGPVLVLCGAEDRLCPPERHREIAESAPDATLVVVPGSGHLSTLEAPEEVNRALRAWLERPLSRRKDS